MISSNVCTESGHDAVVAVPLNSVANYCWMARRFEFHVKLVASAHSNVKVKRQVVCPLGYAFDSGMRGGASPDIFC